MLAYLFRVLEKKMHSSFLNEIYKDLKILSPHAVITFNLFVKSSCWNSEGIQEFLQCFICLSIFDA